MSYLLFLDESGHDHRECPYEVRGGFAIHTSKLWQFSKEIQSFEHWCFGDFLYRYKIEIKGSTFLKKRNFKNAQQFSDFDDKSRRKHVISFFNNNIEKKPPSRNEFTAYSILLSNWH